VNIKSIICLLVYVAKD